MGRGQGPQPGASGAGRPVPVTRIMENGGKRQCGQASPHGAHVWTDVQTRTNDNTVRGGGGHVIVTTNLSCQGVIPAKKPGRRTGF